MTVAEAVRVLRQFALTGENIVAAREAVDALDNADVFAGIDGDE